MRVNLLFKDGDNSALESIPWNSKDLEKDLDLKTIFNAMANKDSYVFDVCRKTVLNSLKDRETIMYRQDVMKDAIENQAMVRDIYTTVVSAVAEARKQYFWTSRSSPEFVLYESISVLKIYLSAIARIREIGRSALPSLHSEGFVQFFTMIIHEFGEQYIDTVFKHLENLRFPRGIYVRGGIGLGNSLTGYTLVVPEVRSERLVKRIRSIREPRYTYVLPDRDESGAQALAEMRTRSIAETADLVSESAENILAFIDRLKEEIAFYLGCINLWNKLKSLNAKVSFPEPEDDHKKGSMYRELYDAALVLRTGRAAVGNSLIAENDSLIFITGANKGGKSTLLRAIGQAQLMMQCGMFVAAESFSTCIASGIFTHFKREEDSAMVMGKLDEELNRMSKIIDNIHPGSRLLFNESFSSTNVREGAELAMQIINALLDTGMKIVFVTHFNELAEAYIGNVYRPTFLGAERLEDGTRTFRVIRADPIPTSFGYDIFKKIFGESGEIQAATGSGNLVDGGAS